jgi:hypothetical protein
VDDNGLRIIAEGCLRLEILSISSCDCVSPAGLFHLGKLPFLRELDMSEWKDGQLLGPWHDNFLDGLVDRLNRANALEEVGEEEGEEGSDRLFSLENLDLRRTAYTEAGGLAQPGPNVLALRAAGVYVKMDCDK